MNLSTPGLFQCSGRENSHLRREPGFGVEVFFGGIRFHLEKDSERTFGKQIEGIGRIFC